MVNSGGCRNSEGGANPIGGGAYLLGWQFFSQKLYESEKMDREEGKRVPGAPLDPPMINNDTTRINKLHIKSKCIEAYEGFRTSV